VFLYDIKFMQHPWKFRMHWLAPYVIKYVMEIGAVQLEMLNGEVLGGLVNGSQMKIYRDGQPSMHKYDLHKNLCTIIVYYSNKNKKKKTEKKNKKK
jgi:hypothetical protein